MHSKYMYMQKIDSLKMTLLRKFSCFRFTPILYKTSDHESVIRPIS